MHVFFYLMYLKWLIDNQCILVDARGSDRKISIGREMTECDRLYKPLPTVVAINRDNSTTTRRLKESILTMTKFKGAERNNIIKITEELTGKFDIDRLIA